MTLEWSRQGPTRRAYDPGPPAGSVTVSTDLCPSCSGWRAGTGLRPGLDPSRLSFADDSGSDAPELSATPGHIRGCALAAALERGGVLVVWRA